MYALYKKAQRALIGVFFAICYAASVIMPFSLFVQVVFRYVFKRPISGIEELATACFTLLILFGSAILFKDRQYIIVDVFVNMFPPRAKRIADASCQLAMIAIFAVLIYASLMALPAQRMFYSVVLKIPRALYTVAFMVSCAFMLLCCVEEFFKELSGRGTEVLADRQ